MLSPCFVQITMSGISTLSSGQAQWRELQAQGYNPLLLASQVGSSATLAYIRSAVVRIAPAY